MLRMAQMIAHIFFFLFTEESRRTAVQMMVEAAVMDTLALAGLLLESDVN